MRCVESQKMRRSSIFHHKSILTVADNIILKFHMYNRASPFSLVQHRNSSRCTYRTYYHKCMIIDALHFRYSRREVKNKKIFRRHYRFSLSPFLRFSRAGNFSSFKSYSHIHLAMTKAESGLRLNFV